MLVIEQNLQFLVFDLLVDGIEFAVVADIPLLLVVFGDLRFGLFGILLCLLYAQVQIVDAALDVVDAGLQAGHFVLQVLHLGRKHTLDFVDGVDLGIDLLEIVERHNLLLHRVIDGIRRSSACCHICRFFAYTK